MAGKDHSLSLIIRAVDEATAPMRAVHAQMAKLMEPIRQVGASIAGMGKEAGLSHLTEGFKHVGEGIKETVEHAKKLGEVLLFSEVAGAAALYELTKSAVEAGSELKHAAERAGLTVDAYAQLRFAAGQAGVTQEEFAGSMDKFNKSLGLAKGRAGPLYEFLQRNAPTVAQQVVHAKNMTEALGLMAGVFTKVQDPMRQAALQQAAFGKGSKEFAHFLSQGEVGIAALMKRYKDIAGSQEEFADRSEESEKALKETGAAFDGLRNAAATGLMPALKAIAEVVTGIVSGNRENIRAWAESAGKAIETWVKGGGIQDLVKWFREFGATVKKVVEFIGGLKGVAIGVGAIMAGPLLMSIVSLGGALFSLVPAITSVVFSMGTLILGPVIAAISGFITAIGMGATAMEAFNLVLWANPVGAVVLGATALAGVGLLIYKNWEPLKTFFDELWESMKHPIDSMKGGMLGDMGAWIMGADPDGAPAGAPRASLGAGQVAPAGGGSLSPQTAKVSVHFENAPKGTRVVQDKGNTADVEVHSGLSSWIGL